MIKKFFNKKILLLDVIDDEIDIVVWIEPKKVYFNCGCCKKCLCNDITSCKNCGCACNCIIIDEYDDNIQE